MMVRNLLQAMVDEPDGPLLGPAGLTAGTKAPALAGKSQQSFMTAIRAPDPGKSVHRIAAVKIAGHHPLCDRPQSSLLMLKLFLIDRQKGLPVILEQSIKGAIGESPGMVGHCRTAGAGLDGEGFKKNPLQDLS